MVNDLAVTEVKLCDLLHILVGKCIVVVTVAVIGCFGNDLCQVCARLPCDLLSDFFAVPYTEKYGTSFLLMWDTSLCISVSLL